MSNNFVPDFTQQEYRKIIDAVERRQRNYICGDASYKELGAIADELKRRSKSAVPFKC
tara:strand:+ start:264 stop:437 length:174 start_codon:yes stop_codon:yes gene_type:complete